MEGLLGKAIAFRTHLESRGGLKKSDKSTETSSLDGLSPEEQEDLNRTMETMLGQSRMQVDEARFVIQARKKGLLLPALVNLGAVVVLAAGIFGFWAFFSSQNDAEQKRLQIVSTNEGKLLDTMRKEAEANMASKNKQILDIQGQLETLDKDRKALATGLETRLAEKEAQLRKDLGAELEKERKRLAATGLKEEDVNNRLQTFQNQMEEKSRQELTAYREKMDGEVKALEQDLAGKEADYRKLLDTARQDRTRLQKESSDKLSQMENQLAAKQKELDQAVGQADLRLKNAQDEMKRLGDLRDLEVRLDDQIASWYQRIRRDLEARKYDDAGKSLDLFAGFLAGADFERTPDLIGRRDSERFLLSLLRDLVEFRRKDSRTQGILEDSLLVEKARSLFTRAKAAQTAGQTDEAYRLYAQLLAVMPETAQAWSLLSARQKSLDGTGSGSSTGQVLGQVSNTPTDQTLSLVRSAVEAPDWEDQKRKLLAEARSGLDQDLQKLSANNQELTSRVKELNKKIADQDAEQKKLAARPQADAAAREETRRLQDELNKTKDVWEKERSQLEARINLAQAQGQAAKDSADRALALLDTVKSDLESTRANLVDRTNDLGSARTDNQILRDQLARNETTRQDLQGKMEVLQQQNTNLQGRISSLESARPSPSPRSTPGPVLTASPPAGPATPAPDSQALVAARKALDDSRAETQKLKDSYQSLKTQLDQELASLASARTDLATMNGKAKEAEGQLARYRNLESSWKTYVGSVPLEELRSGKTSLQARLKLDAFLAQPEMEALFPGLYLHVKEYNRQFEEAGARTVLLQLIDVAYSLGTYGSSKEKLAYLQDRTKTSKNPDYQEFLGLLGDLLDN